MEPVPPRLCPAPSPPIWFHKIVVLPAIGFPARIEAEVLPASNMAPSKPRAHDADENIPNLSTVYPTAKALPFFFSSD